MSARHRPLGKGRVRQPVLITEEWNRHEPQFPWGLTSKGTKSRWQDEAYASPRPSLREKPIQGPGRGVGVARTEWAGAVQRGDPTERGEEVQTWLWSSPRLWGSETAGQGCLSRGPTFQGQNVLLARAFLLCGNRVSWAR